MPWDGGLVAIGWILPHGVASTFVIMLTTMIQEMADEVSSLHTRTS